jgi:WD40 repeat protein
MVPGSLSNSNAILAYCGDSVIRTLVESHNQIKVNSEIKKHESQCRGLDWSRVDERYFLSADQDRNIFLWDMNYNLSNPVVKGKSVEAVSDLKFVPYNGSMIFGVDNNGGFTLWDIRNQGKAHQIISAL